MKYHGLPKKTLQNVDRKDARAQIYFQAYHVFNVTFQKKALAAIAQWIYLKKIVLATHERKAIA